MLKDIKQLTELYLHSNGLLPEDKSWSDFHDELVQNASKDAIGLLADANPKDKCKYALFIDIDTQNKNCNVKYKGFDNFVEIEKVDDWSSHLFWQGSGGAQSDKIRNTPHKFFDVKGKFSSNKLFEPLQMILDNYCQVQEGKGKNKKYKETGPLFWDKDKNNESKLLKNIVNILSKNKDEVNKLVKGDEKSKPKILGKFPSLKQGESVFVGLTIDGKPIGEYELFRRYLLFVRIRVGIQKGADKFKYKFFPEVSRELGICPSCHRNKPLLDQWQGTAELSFYQTTNENHLSYAFPESAFTFCQSCADLLFIFKQHLLEVLTRKLGGNQCLILPSIKLIPSDQNEKRRLLENLKDLWDLSSSDIQSKEKRLLYRLGQLPSYATVTFIFGDYITVGKSQNVRRLDELNIIFPDVLPSRLSQIAGAIQETNTYLSAMWSLTSRDWNCTWYVRDDFHLLQNLFHPSWDEDKKNKDRNRKQYKSLRRPEIERYLRSIFYGQEISYCEIADDCYSNLLSAFKISRSSSKDDNNRYTLSNYIGDVLSLMVFISELKDLDPNKEVEDMTENKEFELTAMPELGKFVEMHPLFKDSQYLAPFFVGCLFSYAENLQKDNSRLAAYNWLGTMTLTYDDILQDVYHKTLKYIKSRPKKESIISSPRLQELIKAIAYYDKGRCDNDRVALTAFCHGWSVGRSFIMKKNIVKAIKKKINELKIQMNDEIKKFLEANKEKINANDSQILDDFLKLIPETQQPEISSIWQKSKENKIDEGGEYNE
ncbi:MAG: TM1802 family CRISPR-associated protein [Candidatus Scalinduaceae bacterium]